MLPPVTGGEAADDKTQQGVREGGGFGGRNQNQGRKKSAVQSPKCRRLTTGREGKGREFSSLDLPADSFSGFGLGAKSKWPREFATLFHVNFARTTNFSMSRLSSTSSSIHPIHKFKRSVLCRIEIVCYKGKQQKIPLEVKRVSAPPFFHLPFMICYTDY